MTSPNEPRTASLYHAAPAPAVSPGIAAGIVAAALASYLVAVVVAALLFPLSIVLIAAQLALLATPVVAIALGARPSEIDARPPLRALLGLRPAAPRFYAAAIAIGATAWYLNMRLVALLPITERDTRGLAQLVDGPALVVALAIFAVLPAVCEEILFRGVLARSLHRAMPLAAAAAVSAVVFSAYHLSIAQAVPTLTLGFVLAVVALRADSALPTIAAHVLNNTLAIVMSRNAIPALTGGLTAYPSVALVGCAVATGAGIAIALRGPR